MARPLKNDDDKREMDVCVACSKTEIEELRRRAGKMKLAVYLRARGLGDDAIKIVPSVNENTAAKLRGALARIDKIAVLAGAQNFSNDDQNFWNLLRELQNELRATHHEILTYANPHD